MNHEKPFTNREIITLLKEQSTELKTHMDSLILPLTAQVTYTNGKLKRVILTLTIIGTATLTLLFTNGSELAAFIMKLI